MALLNHALISVAEFRQRMTVAGSGQAGNIEAAINAATMAIEQRVDRRLVSRGSMTEYHTVAWRDRLFELYVSEWPIVTITTLHEDATTPRTYGASSLLVAGTGYELVYPDRIRRLDGGGSGTLWATGNRVVQNVMLAGYKGQDGLPSLAEAVPEDLKQVAFFVAASIFTENDRKRWGVSSASDASGNYQRFTGYFTPQMDEMLSPYRRREFQRTWERAA